MIENGCEYIALSAHGGARTKGAYNHAQLHGKIYYYTEIAKSKNINPAKYKDFITTCGIGNIQGIFGVNCRHSASPAFPNIDGWQPFYTQSELDEINAERITYTDLKGNKHTVTVGEGPTISANLNAISARQKKKLKSVNPLMMYIPLLSKKLSLNPLARVRNNQKHLRDFISETELTRQYFRERIKKKIP